MFKTIKGKLIFVIIFSVICIIVTSILIIYKRIDIKNDDVQNEQDATEEKIITTSKEEKGINLKGKYNQNDLKFNEKKFSNEKIDITYFQLEGLKDKKIREKINKEIEVEALNGYKNSIDLNKVGNVSVSLYETANFSNILSLCSYSWGKVDDDSDDLVCLILPIRTY